MVDDKETNPFDSKPLRPKGILDTLRESRWKFLLIVLVPGLIFVPIIYTDLCLGTLILPIMAAVLVWLFRVKKFGTQLILGVLALFVATLMISAFFPLTITAASNDISSSDGVLVNGHVDPFYGAKGASYKFSVTVVNTTNVSSIVPNVVIFVDVFGGAANEINQTMSLVNGSTVYYSSNHTMFREYSYSTPLSGTVNEFGFIVNVDGTWSVAPLIYGPVSSDSFAVFSSMFSVWSLIVFGYGFLQYLVLLLFIRFSSRSREARDKLMEDYKKKKEAMATERTGTRVPSPKVSAPSEEMFVCSECGADVPATAKFCPNCGEPFDEDEEGKTVKK